MSYVDGFVAPVPTANRDAYIAHADAAAKVFRRLGATEIVETWAADVPDGKLTSLPMAVKLEPGESVVFSWIRWPDRATRDRAWAAIEGEGAMDGVGEMPFDGKRMIFGGFETILEA
jgi:uncharacterized protein YbaA (DUF1428 family)